MQSAAGEQSPQRHAAVGVAAFEQAHGAHAHRQDPALAGVAGRIGRRFGRPRQDELAGFAAAVVLVAHRGEDLRGEPPLVEQDRRIRTQKRHRIDSCDLTQLRVGVELNCAVRVPQRRSGLAAPSGAGQAHRRRQPDRRLQLRIRDALPIAARLVPQRSGRRARIRFLRSCHHHPACAPHRADAVSAGLFMLDLPQPTCPVWQPTDNSHTWPPAHGAPCG